MKIDFNNPKHEVLINNYAALSKKYNKKGQEIAQQIMISMSVLNAADSLYDVPRCYHPHPLKGEYKGCFAVNVTRTHRIIFRPNHDGDCDFRIDNYKTINSISILDIYKNYH